MYIAYVVINLQSHEKLLYFDGATMKVALFSSIDDAIKFKNHIMLENNGVIEVHQMLMSKRRITEYGRHTKEFTRAD